MTSVVLILLTVWFSLVNASASYSKYSPVVSVTTKTYDQIIAQSNYTSVGNRPSNSGTGANGIVRSLSNTSDYVPYWQCNNSVDFSADFSLHGVYTVKTSKLHMRKSDDAYQALSRSQQSIARTKKMKNSAIE